MNSWSLIKPRKGFFSLAGGLWGLLLIPMFLSPVGEVGAKEYPVKPINIIVPWPPGSSTDLVPRAMAPKLSKLWGVPVTVTNKPGGSGTVGCFEAVKAAPDGYTVFAECPGTSSIQYAWVENLPYVVEDRTYIAKAVATPMGMVVRADSPWKTVAFQGTGQVMNALGAGTWTLVSSPLPLPPPGKRPKDQGIGRGRE